MIYISQNAVLPAAAVHDKSKRDEDVQSTFKRVEPLKNKLPLVSFFSSGVKAERDSKYPTAFTTAALILNDTANLEGICQDFGKYGPMRTGRQLCTLLQHICAGLDVTLNMHLKCCSNSLTSQPWKLH